MRNIVSIVLLLFLLYGCEDPLDLPELGKNRAILVKKELDNQAYCMRDPAEIQEVVNYLKQKGGWSKPSDQQQIDSFFHSPTYSFILDDSKGMHGFLVSISNKELMTSDGGLTLDYRDAYRIRHLSVDEEEKVKTLIGLKGRKKIEPAIKTGKYFSCFKLP
jgi:hypothetical protein